jgi:putative alpha-1,2-mannosidase
MNASRCRLLALLCCTVLAVRLPAQQHDVIQYVNPLIGTAKSDVFTRWGNDGGTYPGAVAVSGYMQLSPETKTGEGRGYDFHDSLLYVFSCTHHNSGFPNGSAGRLFVMPLATGRLSAGRPFSHKEEQATPGYYRVRLSDDGTIIEATATVHVGYFRFTFPVGVPREVFIGDTTSTAFVFNERFTGSRVVKGGFVFSFPPVTTAEPLLLRISASTAGTASALSNISKEGTASFDSQRAATAEQWRKALMAVTIDDDNNENKTVFYTALYHSLLIPWVISDVDGYYRGADKAIHRVTGRPEYGNFSPWDSYRSLNPLLTLLYPDKSAAVVESIMDDYRQGGHLPVESMTGNHAVPILVDAWMKGIHAAGSREVYDAMLISLVRGPFIQSDMTLFRQQGFIPSTSPESVTRTVEYAYDDWALAQYARYVMKDEPTALSLDSGAAAWQRLLYVPALLALPRVGNTFRIKPGNAGYKEGDAWVYSYFVPQDMGGLADRMGGDDYFSSRLDSILRDGTIAFDNETVLHIPYLFNAANHPSLTQYWVRKIMLERYGNRPGGLPGNDDLGAMSSWYVFSALGLYPVSPGRPVYSISAPLFRKAELRPGNGKTLIIRGGAFDKPYIQSITFNGQPFRKTELSHDLLLQGGDLSFESGAHVGAVLDKVARPRPDFTILVEDQPVKKVISGQNNWVRFTILNKGAAGTVNVPLLIAGKAIGSKNCFVAGGGQIRDSIVFCLYRLGQTKLSLGETGGAITVDVLRPKGDLPPSVEVGPLETRVMKHKGEPQEVRYTVKSTYWETQHASLTIALDEVVKTIDTVVLEPGEQQQRTWSWPGGLPGWHRLKIADRSLKYRVYDSAVEAVVLDLKGLTDVSGFENTATLVGAASSAAALTPPTASSPPAPPAGQRGIHLGRDAYIQLAGSASLDDIGKELTMLLWVYPETDKKHGLTDIFTNGDNHVLQVSDGKTLTFFAGGWGRGDCTVDLPADWTKHWHLITGVCDSTGLHVYIDGVQRGFTRLEKSIQLFAGGNNWVIGRNEEFPGQRIYEGYIDRPRIFNAALSPAAINILYQQESDHP